MPNAPLTEAQLTKMEAGLEKREEKLKEQEEKLDEKIKNLTEGLEKDREKFNTEVETSEEELKTREDAVELREKDVEKAEGAKPAQVERTNGPSISVVDTMGNVVRKFSEDKHGKEFKDLADEYTKKNKEKGYKLKALK